jgi:heavy metal sensor kinase
MNTRSLKFQLLFWYAGLLAGVFALLGCVTYLALQSSLTNSLRENQLRRARQIAQLVREQVQRHGEARLGDEIELRYAPDLNGRFVRVTQKEGVVLYLSAPPKDQSFDPATLPPALWPQQLETSRQAPLLGSRRMLLTAHILAVSGGASYLIEAGAPMDEVQADLRKWLWFLLTLLPVVAAIALGGGYVLVKRALSPVGRISSSAERLSLHDLSQRLPVPQSGDELERLSVALNRMLERLETALQHSQRFVADASHELRTPLTVLRGELESLVQEQDLPAESRDRLGSALEEVERLANIVEGLFAISRLDAGEATSEWIKFDLAQLAAGTAEQMTLLAEDKHIDLTSTATFGVWVEGDRARMKQVVVNLLDNAIKFTPEGGAVSLTVEARDSKAILEVTDTGIGIPAAALPRIFERFFRVDKARSRELGGAGLGLSIVKSICTAHQGRVEATSAPGQGSRFRVELPLASAPANHHHPHTRTATPAEVHHHEN